MDNMVPNMIKLAIDPTYKLDGNETSTRCNQNGSKHLDCMQMFNAGKSTIQMHELHEQLRIRCIVMDYVSFPEL
eukprot:12118867-Ditylum_brightwellii.AAC.1